MSPQTKQHLLGAFSPILVSFGSGLVLLEQSADIVLEQNISCCWLSLALRGDEEGSECSKVPDVVKRSLTNKINYNYWVNPKYLYTILGFGWGFWFTSTFVWFRLFVVFMVDMGDAESFRCLQFVFWPQYIIKVEFGFVDSLIRVEELTRLATNGRRLSSSLQVIVFIFAIALVLTITPLTDPLLDMMYV